MRMRMRHGKRYLSSLGAGTALSHRPVLQQHHGLHETTTITCGSLQPVGLVDVDLNFGVLTHTDSRDTCSLASQTRRDEPSQQELEPPGEFNDYGVEADSALRAGSKELVHPHHQGLAITHHENPKELFKFFSFCSKAHSQIP